MFGKNEVAGKRTVADGFLVHSIFYTIQGEGPWAGKPTIFVRFAGCNLRCFFCDTDFTGGELFTPEGLAENLVDLATTTGCNHFVLTGGEPLLQPLPALLRLMPEACRFQIETAGTVWQSGLEDYLEPKRLIIVVSPKAPLVHPDIRAHAAAWKYIIRAGELNDTDGLPESSTQREGEYAGICRPPAGTPRSAIYVQPCDESGMRTPPEIDDNIKAAVAVALKYGYNLSMQIHKYAGVE